MPFFIPASSAANGQPLQVEDEAERLALTPANKMRVEQIDTGETWVCFDGDWYPNPPLSATTSENEVVVDATFQSRYFPNITAGALIVPSLPTAPLTTPPMQPHQAYIDGLAASVGGMNAYNFAGLGITFIDAALISYLFSSGSGKSFGFSNNAISNVDELLTAIADFCIPNYVTSFTVDFSGGTNARPTSTVYVGGSDALSGTYIRQSDGTYYQPDHGYVFSKDASDTWEHSSGISATVAPTPWEASWVGSSLDGIVSEGLNIDVMRLQSSCYATAITN